MSTTLPPEWHALMREAELAAELLASGGTLLARASYAQKGTYTQALFAISIGFERLAKLVLVADHAVANKGAWMNDSALRAIGHDIDALMNACEPIGAALTTKNKWCSRPSLPIHAAIVTRLSEFAKSTRYYNLASLTSGRSAQMPEPIKAWWDSVGVPILAKHYKKARRAKDKAQAEAMAKLLGNSTIVIAHDESGAIIADVEALMNRGASTKIVQKYGRLYLFQLVRWLSVVLSERAQTGVQLGMAALTGLHEPFKIFYNDDRYFLSRSTWSIYRP